MAAVFRILGPLEATRDERQLALGGRRERAILGILLLHPGEVVSVERLIDGVWGDARPTSAKHMVHEYVSRLRQALDDETKIATRPPGYLLEPKGDALDADQFARLIAGARAAAREQRHANAVGAYDEALALWRGDALADLALEGDACTDATRLDEERRLATEERIDSALELGHHRELIAQLEHTVAKAPLRERPRAQLMLALYRSGRQTDALERYRQGRALLVDHAGIEPGPELRELERAILRHDPALARAPAMPDRHERPPAARRGRLPVILGALLIVAIGIGAVVYVTGRSSPARPLTQIEASSAAAIDPRTNELVDRVHVGAGPGRIVAGFGSLWVVDDLDNTISRIDVANGDVETIPVDADPTAIAVAGGFVWVACTGTRSVDRIDPRADKLTQRTPVGFGSSAIAVSPGALWVTDRLDDRVTEIDSTTGMVRRTLGAGPTPSDIVYGFGALWIANESSSTISRLDPATRVRREIPVGNGPESIAIGDGSVWVANSLDGTVWRVDPQSDVVQSVIGVGSGPSSVLAHGNAVWVADSYGDQIVRIDPRTNTIVRRIHVGSGPQSLAEIDGRIWLSARASSPPIGAARCACSASRRRTPSTARWATAPARGPSRRRPAMASSASSASAGSTAARSSPISPPPCPRHPTAGARTRSSCAAASTTRTAHLSVRATFAARSSGRSGWDRRARTTTPSWSEVTRARGRAATCRGAWSRTTTPAPSRYTCERPTRSSSTSWRSRSRTRCRARCH